MPPVRSELTRCATRILIVRRQPRRLGLSPATRREDVQNGGDVQIVRTRVSGGDRGAAHGTVARTIGQAAHQRIGETLDRRRIAWREAAVHPIGQPLRNAADRIGHDRHALAIRFLSDQAERLRPQARHDQDVSRRQQPGDARGAEPAGEMNAQPIVTLTDFPAVCSQRLRCDPSPARVRRSRDSS